MKTSTLAFITVMTGIFLLAFEILPLFGWILIFTSIFITVFDVLLRRSSTNIKSTILIAMFILTIIAFLIIAKSFEQIAIDGQQTVQDISKIIGNVVKLIN
jgi:uncharacterized membrane protein